MCPCASATEEKNLVINFVIPSFLRQFPLSRPSFPPSFRPSIPPSFLPFLFFTSFLPHPSHGTLEFLMSARVRALNRLKIKWQD